jgi:hypothetical protein
MKAHQIENGVVVNTLLVESLDFMPNLVNGENGGSIGDRYENGQFIKPPEPTIEPAPAPTKEELMAQLAALTAKIQALE